MDWAAGGPTDADMLYFACGPGHTDINHAHHPEDLLRTDPDPPAEAS